MREQQPLLTSRPDGSDTSRWPLTSGGARRGGRSRLYLSIGCAVLTATMVAGAVAFAAIPGEDGTIGGCYSKRTGVLRVVESDAGDCRNDEVAISWNQAGPVGSAGPAGPTGPQGPPGPEGGSLASFEHLAGLPCRVGQPQEGATQIDYGPAGEITFTCQAAHLFDLNVTIAGGGAGTVRSSVDGIDCPGDCSETFVRGSTVTLTAHDTDTSLFTGWGGDCSGTGPCTVTLDGAREVTATFTPAFILQVSVSAEGRYLGPDRQTGVVYRDFSQSYGSVIVDLVGRCDLPPGPDHSDRLGYGTGCTWKLPSGTYIAAGAQGSSYTPNVSWSGDCWQARNDCDLGPRTSRTNITVRFEHD